MPRKKARSRIYTRQRGGETRYYGDFRDVGGGREALIPEGETRATTDLVVAEALVTARLTELQEAKRDRVLLGVKRRVGLVTYASEHLQAKAQGRQVTTGWVAVAEKHLRTAIQFFCNGGVPLPVDAAGEVQWEKVTDRDLATIGVEHVREYVQWLSKQPNGRGGTLSSSTQKKHLNSLSNLFRRAAGEAVIRSGNPVTALLEKPRDQRREAPWLEVWEGALLLEAARTFPYSAGAEDSVGGRLEAAILEALGSGEAAEQEFVRRMRAAGKLATREKLSAYLAGERIPTKDYVVTAAEVLGVPQSRLWKPKGHNLGQVSPSMYPLLATYLLTGARKSEVLGMLLGDVSFENETITIREHAHRRLKTDTSWRTIPYWPQLQEILGPYIEARRRAGARPRDLLFASEKTGGMINNFEKALDAIAERAGWKRGEVRSKAFRHAYCSARLQTLDEGHPVAERTVAGELGHGGYDLVRRTYSHLGKFRHRSEVVEFRFDQQKDHIPPERLRLLLRVA